MAAAFMLRLFEIRTIKIPVSKGLYEGECGASCPGSGRAGARGRWRQGPSCAVSTGWRGREAVDRDDVGILGALRRQGRPGASLPASFSQDLAAEASAELLGQLPLRVGGLIIAHPLCEAAAFCGLVHSYIFHLCLIFARVLRLRTYLQAWVLRASVLLQGRQISLVLQVCYD